MDLPYEDKNLFVVWSPNIATAVMAINDLECAHLLRFIVPTGDQAGSFWLMFKKDSWLTAAWLKRWPHCHCLPEEPK